MTFAGEFCGGFAGQPQVEVVAVRAQHGGAEDFLAAAALGQFDGEVLAHGGLVFQFQRFVAAGHAGVGFPGQWKDLRRKVLPEFH